MKKLTLINALAAASLLVTSSAFAVSIGGGSVGPQKSLALSLDNLNHHSAYDVSCDVSNPSSKEVNVIVGTENTGAMYLPFYVNDQQVSFGALKPGSNNKLGAKHINWFGLAKDTKFVVTNADEKTSIVVNNCNAKMVG